MKKKIVIFLMMMLFPFTVFAADNPAETNEKSPSGLIFNVENVLFDLDSFQSGIGYKVSLNELSSLRFLADIFYSNSLDTFSTNLGITYTRYFELIDRINPYLGGFVDLGYLSQRNLIDDDNWTKNLTVPVSCGLVLGVEYFLLDFLSIFAEYSTELQLTIQKETQNVAGEITEGENTYSSVFDTGIGNNSSLGLIVYFDEIIELKDN